MILPDVNVLVYAFREDTPQHDRCAAWLSEQLARSGGLALCDAVVSGFLRIVTHPRIFSPPAPTERAFEFVQWLRESPGIAWLGYSPAVWDAFGQICAEDRGVRGNLVPDAYLAALCIAHGATIATDDRDFARFEVLRRVKPEV